jgi:hypothetical protein
VPLIETAMPVKVAVPGFDSVTVCAVAVLPTVVAAKVSEVGESTASATGAAVAPAPLSATVCVDPVVPPLLSVTVNVAL